MNFLEAATKIIEVTRIALQDRRVIAGAAHFQGLLNDDHPVVQESSNPLIAVGEIFDAIFLGKLPHEHKYGQYGQNVVVDWKQVLDKKDGFIDLLLDKSTPYVPLTAYSFSEATSTQPRKVNDKVSTEILQQMVWSNPSLLPEVAETYKLEEFESNRMIIFNHTYVLGFPEDRLGTEKDVGALKRTFGKFSFEFEEFEDKTKTVLLKELHNFADSDFSKVGCIAIVILSHGGSHGYIYAKDDSYHESELTEIFHYSRNRTLFGKPIIFIIQTYLANELNEESFDQACRTDVLVADNRNMGDYSIPVQADTLVLHSTYYEQVSIRNIHEGSWFIQELCNKIENHYSEDLQSIIVRVLRGIAYYKQFKYQNKSTKEDIIYKQMPMCTTTLTRKLFLIRKQNETLQEVISNAEMADNKELHMKQESCEESTDSKEFDLNQENCKKSTDNKE